jgi:hypothetical protein
MKASVLISAALSILISSVAALPAPAANSVVSRNPGVDVLRDLNKKSLRKCLIRSSIYQGLCSLQIADVIMSDRRDCAEGGHFCWQFPDTCCDGSDCMGFLIGHCRIWSA